MNDVFSNFTVNNTKYMLGIQRTQSTQQKKHSGLKNAASIAAGGIVGLSAIPVILNEYITKVSPQDLDLYKKIMSYILPNIDTFTNTKQNILNILSESGLKEKGVELLIASKDNKQELMKVLSKEIKGNSRFKQSLRESFLQKFTEGLNACFAEKTHKIIIPAQQLYMSAYHEAGHAWNCLKSPTGKFLQKSRIITPFGISAALPLTLCAGLLHNKKDISSTQKSKYEKMKDFIKNNAGKITMATYIPILAEEGLASFNGLRLSKKYLDAEKIQALAFGYTLSWSTYFLLALGVASTVWMAIALKDKIAGKDKNT